MTEIQKLIFEKKVNEIYQDLNNNLKYSDYGLLTGLSGIVLFYFYYAKYTQKQEAYDRGFDLLSHIIENISPVSVQTNYSNGLAGLGWLIEHLKKNDFIDIGTNDILDEIDKLLFPEMIKELHLGNYDFMSGALGISYYYLNRDESPEIRNYLHLIPDKLETISEETTEGIKWKSKNKYGQKEWVYNLGLSHGSSSIISILTKVISKNINVSKSKYLIEGGIDFLLNQKLEDKYKSSFPVLSNESVEQQTDSRLAWCHGDLGISIALWQASQVLGRKDLENIVINVIHKTTQRKDLNENGIKDARLCHGTAGIAQILMRMHQYTKIESLKEDYEYWFDQTIKMANFNDGIAGYKTWRSEEYGGWAKMPGLLHGASGIGLAILSYLDNSATWDECLMLI